jgi:hypothetical protein
MADKDLEGYEPFAQERARDDDDLVRTAAVMNVAPYLKGLQFPASQEEVRRKAKEGGADAAALEEIEKLPERTFQSPVDLIDKLGDEVEGIGEGR